MRALLVFLLLLFLAACGSDQPGVARVRRQGANAAQPPAGAWVTVLERSMSDKRSTPERFTARSDRLLVITTMGNLRSRYSPGLVITNLLSDSSTLPVASVRAEQVYVGTTSVDSTIVQVQPGPLYFFVAQHQGLADWKITLQEFRPSPAEGDPPG